MKVDVLNIDGEKTGRAVELSDAVFGAEVNEHAIYLDVKQHMANRRQGTHKSKEKGEIRASTRKLRKQKGSGAARVGSAKNPLFRGGGRIFGPRPKVHNIRLNKKVKKIARLSALGQKMSQGKITLLEDITVDSPKTKVMANVFSTLLGSKGKALLITGEYDKMLYLSTRNLPKANVMVAKELNTYSILNCEKLIITESAVEPLTAILS